MFNAEIENIQPGTDKYVLILDQFVLNYDQVIENLFSSEVFRSFFIQTLIDSRFSAYRFETPFISTDLLFQPFEFVLIDSQWLNRAQDEVPFEEHFKKAHLQEILVFDNLGGDATLVVPSPISSDTNYAHLAAFLRTGSDSQKDLLFQTIAQTLTTNISDKPLWLSTAGGGVDWLHVRFDTRPKYYAHQPYRIIAS